MSLWMSIGTSNTFLPGNTIILLHTSPLNLDGICWNPSVKASWQELTTQISLFSSAVRWMSMTGGGAECLFGNQHFKKSSCLWLFMSTSFNQAESCREESWHFLLHLYGGNLSATEIKSNQIMLFLLIKYEQSWETIWNAGVQFDKQDSVICDLNLCCAFVATSYWLRLLV